MEFYCEGKGKLCEVFSLYVWTGMDDEKGIIKVYTNQIGIERNGNTTDTEMQF